MYPKIFELIKMVRISDKAIIIIALSGPIFLFIMYWVYQFKDYIFNINTFYFIAATVGIIGFCVLIGTLALIMIKPTLKE